MIEIKQLVNEGIKHSKVMLIDETGNREIEIKQALDIAEAQELDLVQVGEKDSLSVCKIMDYSKFVYEQNKRNKQKDKRVELKEIKVTWKISPHDLETKINNAKRIMVKDKDRVKFTVLFKGREIKMQAEGRKLLESVSEMLVDVAVKCSNIKVEGNNLTLMFEPKR